MNACFDQMLAVIEVETRPGHAPSLKRWDGPINNSTFNGVREAVASHVFGAESGIIKCMVFECITPTGLVFEEDGKTIKYLNGSAKYRFLILSHVIH